MLRRLLVLVFLVVFLTACSSQPALTTEQEQPVENTIADPSSEAEDSELDEEVQELPDATPTIPAPPTERIYSPPFNGYTQIRIDGDPADWTNYPAQTLNSSDDSIGNVDITHVYAFANTTYLYLMVEVAGEIGSYVQLDVDLNPPIVGGGFPDYMLNAQAFKNTTVNVARIEDEQFSHLGAYGETVQGAVFELRVPLYVFDGPEVNTVRVRVMDGICCEADWITVDHTAPVEILNVSEQEFAFVAQTDLTASDSAFCTDATLARPDTLPVAEDITVPDGFRAEYLVPPSGLNTPSDVIVTDDGNVLVASSRAQAIHQVASDGTVSVFSRTFAYSLDQDEAGTIYSYNYPNGDINRLSTTGSASLVARMPPTACESTLAVAPNGNLYIGHNACSGDSIEGASLYLIPPSGGAPAEILSGLSFIMSIDIASDGTVYATLGDSLESIDPSTGERSQIAKLPAWPSFHSLVVADDKTAYISSGDMDASGNLYRVSPDGDVEVFATFENNGLEGLALTADGEIIGVQRAIGGLQIINLDGAVQALVEPNGIVSPQTLAVSPCGELVTVNDEAGRLTLTLPSGQTSPLVSLNSFQPPQTFIAFGREGWYIAGESAPGFPSQLNRYLSTGSRETMTADIPEVSGVAVAPDGTVYASATAEGTIVRFLSDDTQEVFVTGLITPQGLALATDGTLYVVTGGQGFGTVFSTPAWGDTVLAIAPDGSTRVLASIRNVADLVIGADGMLYAAAENAVYRINSAGKVERFADGFSWVRGITFDGAGNLFVADDKGNNIVRISGFPQVSISGVVTAEDSGEPLSGAYVRVTQASAPFAGQIATTGTDGSFSLSVAPDAYEVVAWADGYEAGAAVSISADTAVEDVNVVLTRSE